MNQRHSVYLGIFLVEFFLLIFFIKPLIEFLTSTNEAGVFFMALGVSFDPKKSNTYEAQTKVSSFEVVLNVSIPMQPVSNPSTNRKIFPVFLPISNDMF